MGRLDDMSRQDSTPYRGGARTPGFGFPDSQVYNREDTSGMEWPGYTGPRHAGTEPDGLGAGGGSAWPGYAGANTGGPRDGGNPAWPGYAGRGIKGSPDSSGAWPGRADAGIPVTRPGSADTEKDTRPRKGLKARRTANTEAEDSPKAKKPEKAERARKRAEQVAKTKPDSSDTAPRAADAHGAMPGNAANPQGQPMEQDPLTGAKPARHKWYKRIPGIIILATCIYVVFLIYGVMSTQYVYDKTGKVAPQVVTVADIREKAKFDRVLAQYYSLRNLYERILVLDERIAQGVEDKRVVAGEYALLLVYFPLGVIFPFVILPSVVMMMGVYGAFPVIRKYMIDPYYENA